MLAGWVPYYAFINFSFRVCKAKAWANATTKGFWSRGVSSFVTSSFQVYLKFPMEFCFLQAKVPQWTDALFSGDSQNFELSLRKQRLCPAWVKVRKKNTKKESTKLHLAGTHEALKSLNKCSICKSKAFPTPGFMTLWHRLAFCRRLLKQTTRATGIPSKPPA